ncbi:MAG: aminoacyl-tRNA hydrolase, partial [Chloroflexi bacterium CFX6]|nr:aminoacyl-tRNA hydrolase [Chloroflexi bacterium CFX6]
MDDVVVSPDLTIPGGELALRFSRSGGPGGQHVNVTASRVELLWDVAGSGALTDDQRERLLSALASRLDGTGVLRIVVEDTRSQHENRARAMARLATVVAAALRP